MEAPEGLAANARVKTRVCPHDGALPSLEKEGRSGARHNVGGPGGTALRETGPSQETDATDARSLGASFRGGKETAVPEAGLCSMGTEGLLHEVAASCRRVAP